MENSRIADLLQEVAALLELDDQNPFRIRAYKNAAWTIEDHPTPLAEMVARGQDLTELDFIGKDLAASVAELVRSGRLRVLEELSEKVPRSLIQVMRIPGIGPKKAARLWRGLGVTTVEELETAASDGRVAELEGFGAKTQESLLRRIERAREQGRIP